MAVKNGEWFRIAVIAKHTDHNIAPDIVGLIENLLRGFNIHEFEVSFDAWGDEPDAAKRRIDNRRPSG